MTTADPSFNHLQDEEYDRIINKKAITQAELSLSRLHLCVFFRETQSREGFFCVCFLGLIFCDLSLQLKYDTNGSDLFGLLIQLENFYF